ncbi:YciI family protein [Enterobacter sp. C4G1]|uniref:YciI family protein n=1 Tax=Enterobacter sp. C4G1 TaxID=3458724 RepID=UPI0040678DDA
MLHAVTLTYLKQPDAIASHLDAHKQWLVRGFNEGKILFAGPLSNHAGGYILFQGDSVSEIQNYLQDDPLIMHNIVDAEIIGIEPTLCAQGFPAKWAEKARFI